MAEISENTSKNRIKKQICAALLAHVDAGKTTLSESILYLCGNIRKLGRVDHGDAFLDTYALERSRGITIFSKQAVMDLPKKQVEMTLLDTPGHVDFSSEMERTLQVLDYAILVISGADGVQGHTRTLWNLLKRYRIPVFLFINKMDQNGTDREARLEELKQKLDDGCIAFDQMDDKEAFWENIAMCDEEALGEYLKNGEISKDRLVHFIAERKVFPCYFGSALKVEGVEELLAGLEEYTIPMRALLGSGNKEENLTSKPFGARIYKISRDNQGNRLTHMRITSGSLKVKDILENAPESEEHWEEKVNQIRIYNGEKYEMVQKAEAGMVCAVAGLSHTRSGEGLGTNKETNGPVLEPVLNYRVILPEGCDVHTMLRNLRLLEEEDPMLRIVWNEELGEIHVRLMGAVQTEILQSMIKERFKVEVTFGTGNIVYKETIKNTVEGVGHFEPLRHYAEVHLLMEPGEPGSGIKLDTMCSTDVLDLNWQRLILTHLAEKVHRGVLIGAALTDVKITLIAGRAHLKHTEGGDFRQSTYRAVRQGLMQAENVLLEPYYDFRLEIPSENVGRALTDIQKMSGKFEPPQTEGDLAVIVGYAPVATMRDYQMEVTGYTKGRGKIFCTFKGYEPCHNAEEVIEVSGYIPENELENPPGSVFCAHGAGFNVPWNEVPDYMHIEPQLDRILREMAADQNMESDEVMVNGRQKSGGSGAGQDTRKAAAKAGAEHFERHARESKELEEIFIRTYGRIERKPVSNRKTVTALAEKKQKIKKEEPVQEYLLVDGYNVIFAWDDLKELAKINIEAARGKLMDVLCNYQGFKKCTVILVFDAYKVEGFQLEIQRYHNIHVVYTKEAETADQYIEKVVHEIGHKYHVTVVTSDGVEQVVTLGQGGTLISSREFKEEVEIVSRQIREETQNRRESSKNYLFDHMDKEMVKTMEAVRLGHKKTPFEE